MKSTSEEKYTVTTEWDATRYIGTTLDCNYKRRQVHLPIPDYVKNTETIAEHIEKETTPT